MLPVNLPSNISVIGKPTYQIATEMFGNSSDFRELFKLSGITPFDPQSKIDKLGKLESVMGVGIKLDALNKSGMEAFTQIQKAANDVVKLDWLMN